MKNDIDPRLLSGRGEVSGRDFGLSFHTNVKQDFNPPFPVEPAVFPLVERYVGKVVYLDPRRVKPMVGQPREEFEGIDDLAETIKEDGQQTSIVVHPIVNDPDYDVELQAGERRTHACIRGGLMVRAEIRSNPQTVRRHYVNAVVENFNRKDLTLLETVKMVARLLADGHSEKEIARMTGKTIEWVTQYSSLGKMDMQALKLIGSEATDQYSEDGRKLRRRTALPLSIALSISKLPLGQQMQATRHIIEQNLMIDAARDFVRKQLEIAGRVTKRRPPREVYGTLVREAGRAARLFDRYLDMPQRELSQLLESREASSRQQLVQQMMGLVSSLHILIEAVRPPHDSSLSKAWVDQGTVGWHPALLEWCKKQLG